MKKRNLLIICLTIKDIYKIYKLDLSVYTSVVVASDDFKVHQEVKRLNAVDKVIFLQKAICHTKVADDVICMTNKVNNYFEKVAELDIFNKKELFWTCYAEGGYTVQRLQDAMLALESSDLIFEEHQINEVITIGPNNSLTLELLKRLALNKGYKVISFKSRQPLDNDRIKDIIRPSYFLLRSLICKITSRRPKHYNISNLVLFHIHGSSAKHIQSALFPQKEFLKNGYTPINIIWGSSKQVKKINKKGHKAIAIESYLKFGDIFLSFIKTLLVFIKIKRLKNMFYDKDTFIYKGVDIADIVYESVKQFLYTDAPENFRYRTAAQRFVSEYSEHLVAIKYSSAKYLAKGTILSEIFEDKYIKFDYAVGVGAPNSYLSYTSKKYHNFFSNNYIVFAPNKIERANFIEYENISEKNTFIYGSGKANTHFKQAKTLSKEDSKRKIGIKKDYDIYLLLDFPVVMQGWMSSEEVLYLSNIVVDFIKKHSNIALIIKPHPSANLSILNTIISNKTDNIYVVNKNMTPDHALNLADIMITKESTMGIEAMIYDVQVVSVHLQESILFKAFGEAAHYIYDKIGIITFLEKTLSSKESLNKWKELFAEKRILFIEEYYPKMDKSSEEILVETMIEKINDRKYST